MVVVLMGVTGTGKTTVGEALAARTGWPFADADDFHSAANRAKMHAGIPLTDEDREPWLKSLHQQILTWIHDGINGILACSALKESYRTELTEGTAPGSVRFIFLTGPPELIRQRMEARHGHYMPESLLPSQLSTLEPPHDALVISIDQTVPAMVDQILSALAKEGYAGVSELKH
ncbi:MAG TPA: gluconokinase [Acidobacteriaceae bacterium]|nr:gluconokinase [Acidobacteriaceae bacterium]